MSANLKNLSDPGPRPVPSAEKYTFAIVVAEWNSEITNSLLDGAYNTLLKYGVNRKNIFTKYVPGSFELTLGAAFMAEYTDVDAVICLGCVVRGETPHFDYVCSGVTQGITELNLLYNLPFIFGILTTDTLQQAKDRSGGKHGNKGDEAAIAAIKMAALQQEISGFNLKEEK
jgi:6,7-dimethyl-8-ribityllumazine synthase